MKHRIVFDCEFCDNYFFRRVDCEEHEAAHFGLTRKEYLDWKILNIEAAEAGRRCGSCNNSSTRTSFDNAIKALCLFEENHKLPSDIRKPTDFFY